MNIIEINNYADTVRDALNDLLPQLSSSPERLTEDELLEITPKSIRMRKIQM